MTMPSRGALALSAWLAFLATMPAAHAGGPAEALPHVVSLNLCADKLVLRLADRAQVAAVTALAGDPRGSTVAAEAAGVPVTRGLAEEIAARRPDLVIAGAFTTRATVGMLKRVGFPVLELGVPTDFDGVRAQIRQVAAALGHLERGEAMVAELDARLAAVVPASKPLRALVMRPNAFTVAPGSLGDAVIRAAGLVNVAAEIGQDRFGQVPLEAAALADADLIVLDEGEPGTPSLAGRTTLPALVLWELRIPRALLGALVGFSLGLAGAAMQGYLRNPLADPGILGISSAAALGAVVVFYGGFAGSFVERGE